MTNDRYALCQLDKVIALADSNHEGEALGALRIARRILTREGMTFADLIQSARRGQITSSQSFFSGSQRALQSEIEDLQDELQAHVEQNQSLTNQIDMWRRRVFELEQMMALNQAEIARWKEMARETAERLWDLGQIAKTEVALKNVVVEQQEIETIEEASQDIEPVKVAV